MLVKTLCWAAFSTVILVTSAHANLLPERVANAVEARIADGMYKTLVFGVVDGDKSEVVVFGKLDDGKVPDGDTVYEIGSITKTFTATLLAEEVLAGHISLDTPVAKLLPSFTIPSHDGKEITLGEIGMQYSGLPRVPSNLVPKDSANPYADYDAAKLKEFLKSYMLPRDRGASYEYSNLAFGLLGYALAQSAHTTYGDMVAQDIFAPLGMTMSGTRFSGAMRTHLALGHDVNGKPAKNWEFDVLSGAGAIRSTANDMLRYLKANMGANHTSLEAAMNFAQQPRADMAKGMRIGLAWMTTDKGIVWHNGGTGGYRSFIGFTMDRRYGVVVLTNTAVEADDLGFATLDPNAPIAAGHKQITLASKNLDIYVGNYKLADKFLLKIFRADDGLYAQATGQGAFPIYASAPDEFFAKVADISVSFKRDAGGQVTGLVLHQNGDHAAPKLSATEIPAEPKEATLDVETLESYVGKYRFGFGVVLDVTLNGDQLSAQLTGQSSFPIYPRTKDEFFYKVVNARLSFERDTSGKAVAVVLHQNGRDLRAPKMSP